MRSLNSGILRLVITVTLGAVQLLPAAWIPVVHAQMAVPSQTATFEDTNSPVSTPGHNRTLCRICTASHVYSPEAYGIPELTTTSREYTCRGVTYTAPRQHHSSTGNAIRAPPSR